MKNVCACALAFTRTKTFSIQIDSFKIQYPVHILKYTFLLAVMQLLSVFGLLSIQFTWKILMHKSKYNAIHDAL